MTVVESNEKATECLMAYRFRRAPVPMLIAAVRHIRSFKTGNRHAPSPIYFGLLCVTLLR